MKSQQKKTQFETKTLEKRMCFNELKMFLLEHPKYRLLTVDELNCLNRSSDNSIHTFIKDVKPTSDGKLYTSIEVYSGSDIIQSSVLVKLPVIVTYSSEYLEILACTIIDMDSSIVNEFIKFLPKVLQYATIYGLPDGQVSFEPYDDDRQFMIEIINKGE